MPTPMADAWIHWRQKYAKAYGTDSEKEHRQNCWVNNYNYIATKYDTGITYELELNEYADLTVEEFVAAYTGIKHQAGYALRERNPLYLTSQAVSASRDWVAEGAVTPIRNQGHCGSCWAFSATGALEGLNKIKGNALTVFSPQVLVDCSTENSACQGGLMDYAFSYTATNGTSLESNYPYTGKADKCKREDKDKVMVNKSSTDVPEDDNDQMVAALDKQPVSVAVNASPIMLYKSGVFDDFAGCEGHLNHGILAVGYGEEDGKMFYKVKNSWGEGWGEKGYIKLARKTGKSKGICGVTSSASYPTA